MTLNELGKRLELLDDEENIYCYVENDRLYASFSKREDVVVEVLTPYERQLVKKGKFFEDDIARKEAELQQLAHFQVEGKSLAARVENMINAIHDETVKREELDRENNATNVDGL